MSDSLEAIKRVIDAFERSNWSEIDVRSGDLHIHLATGPTAGAPVATPATGPATGPATELEPPAPRASSTAPDFGDLPDDAHIVVSPSPGIFWRSPEPGAPPFAEVGQTVDGSVTLCIVEVMKLMNHIKAGVSGEVVAVYGTDGVAVDKGQPLFVIASAGSSS